MQHELIKTSPTKENNSSSEMRSHKHEKLTYLAKPSLSFSLFYCLNEHKTCKATKCVLFSLIMDIACR